MHLIEECDTARVFVVGCPRSGTTATQVLVSKVLRCASFPESHIFPMLIGRRWSRYASRVLRVDKGASERISRFFCQEPFVGGIAPPNLDGLTLSQAVRACLKKFDEFAKVKGSSGWVEKTPRNLRFVGCINKYVKRPFYIHALRHIGEAVASLVEATRRWPDDWGGARSVRDCVRRWTDDFDASMRYFKDREHLFVLYSDLVGNSDRESGRILERYIELFGAAPSGDPCFNQVVSDFEYWKKQKPSVGLEKFFVELSRDEQELVKKVAGRLRVASQFRQLIEF